jgi:UDPglucose 6-dehydrogenase
VGSFRDEDGDLVAALHAGIDGPIVRCDVASAEMIKLAANAALMTRISFINEIANVCEATGADVVRVAEGIGLDRRIGPSFLRAGIGFGGSCFPKDTHALSAFARAAGVTTGIVDAAIKANERQMQLMVDKIWRAVGKRRGARVAVLGLSFKPNTDDLRAAPALAIIRGLKRRGVKLTAFDPVAMAGVKGLPDMRGVALAGDPYEAATGADAMVIVTEWNEFRGMNLSRLKRLMRRPVLCDLRNIYDPDAVEAAGLVHVGVGRGRAERTKPKARGGRVRKVRRAR